MSDPTKSIVTSFTNGKTHLGIKEQERGCRKQRILHQVHFASIEQTVKTTLMSKFNPRIRGDKHASKTGYRAQSQVIRLSKPPTDEIFGRGIMEHRRIIIYRHRRLYMDDHVALSYIKMQLRSGFHGEPVKVIITGGETQLTSCTNHDILVHARSK